MNQNQIRNQTDAVTDQIRTWYQNSPTAQRAYARLRADVDNVVAQARPKVQELWDQIGPMIDPPAKKKETPPHPSGPTATPGSRDS